MGTSTVLTESLEGFELIVYDRLDSTQEEAKRLVQSGQLHQNTLILSKHQTQGKGTHGRHWVSSGGWYLTFVHFKLANQHPLPLCPHYTLLAAQAVAESLTEVFELLVTIKPVNDLVVNNQKLGGILIESTSKQPKQLDVLYTGIGINHQPVEMENYEATSVLTPISLLELGFSQSEIEETTALFLKTLSQKLDQFYATLSGFLS